MNAAQIVLDVIELARELAGLAADVIRAIDSGDAPRVEAAVPATLRTTMAKEIADARARLKFGSGR